MKFRAIIRPAFAIASLAAIPSGPALAVDGYDISAFTSADLDVSGSLSTAEFNTTLEPDLPRKALAKSFRRADLNRNGAIQVNEFLIFRRVIILPKNPLERWFHLADTSIDGTVSFDEFTASFKAKVALVSIRRDFLRADRNESGTVTLLEYSNFRRGLTPPNRLTVFDLADFDADGQLTVAEFGHAYSQSTSDAAILERFVKLDDNRDGVLTSSEWNPGVVH